MTGENPSISSARDQRVIGVQNAAFAFQFTAAGFVGAAINAAPMADFWQHSPVGHAAFFINTTTTGQTFTIAGQTVAVPRPTLAAPMFASN